MTNDTPRSAPPGETQDVWKKKRETALTVGDTWNEVLAEMEATAEELAEAGWQTVQLHPGDVTILPVDEIGGETYPGFDVLVPSNEFNDLESVIDDAVGFDSHHVYRADTESVVYLLVVTQDTDAEVAILAPLFYPAADTDSVSAAADHGELFLTVRRLAGNRYSFQYDDPDGFTPE